MESALIRQVAVTLNSTKLACNLFCRKLTNGIRPLVVNTRKFWHKISSYVNDKFERRKINYKTNSF